MVVTCTEETSGGQVDECTIEHPHKKKVEAGTRDRATSSIPAASAMHHSFVVHSFSLVPYVQPAADSVGLFVWLQM